METDSKKVAFIISGAAAYIPQEIACVKAIMKATYPGAREKITPTVIAGTSSGSICTILLNGIIDKRIDWEDLETKIIPAITNSAVYNDSLFQKALLFGTVSAIFETKKMINDGEELFNDIVDIIKNHKGMSLKEIFEKLVKISKESVKEWDDIKELLHTVKNIIEKAKNWNYQEVKEAYLEIFENIKEGYILDTAPLVKTLEKYVNNEMQFTNMSELPCRTIISAVEAATGREKRFDSKNQDTNDSIVDVLLASTAIPVVFPERKAGSQLFIDGGTGTDNFPVEDIIETKEKFDEVYVITYKNSRLLNQPITHSLKGIPILSNFLFAYQVMSANVLPFQLSQALSLVSNHDNAYLYMPEFDEDFSPLNFDSMPKQLNLASAYCKQNAPKKITDVLKFINFPVSSEGVMI